MSRSSVFLPVLACSLALTAGDRGAAAFDVECREIVPTEVRLSQPLVAGNEAKVRQQLAEQAAAEAIRRVIGVSVTSRSALAVSEADQKVEERYRARMAAKSAGFARTSILSESVSEEAHGMLLSIRFAAEVCVPKRPEQIRETVHLGRTLSTQGENQPRLRAVLADTFGNSTGFTVNDEDAETADILVEAKIDRVQVGDVAGAANAPMVRALLPQGADTPTSVKRIDLGLTLTGKRQEDGSIVTHSVQDFRNVPASRDAKSAAEQFIVEKLTQASREFHDKLLRVRAGTASPPPASLKAATTAPTW